MKQIISKTKMLSVLIVEDDLIIRTKLTSTLKYYFKKVYEADSGESGYNLFLETEPDISFFDIEMKNGNGIELVKKIRKLNKDATIIMLSAYSKEQYLLDLINNNINHFILKPLTIEKLTEVLSKVILLDSNKKIKIFDNMYLDVENNQLIFNKEIIKLRKKERKFLYLLYKNKKRIITYEIIQEYIWNEKFMSDNALKVFIKELRKKLPINIIKNIINEGYILQTEIVKD